ncbi:tetratricopeptide repeat-containing sensor histidine kinase [Fulvivirga maritima]|uniref:sensor histidine kinase n=1 Tax=Fulvivirga maritima TaxID=2904247 RepID=UPI001F3595F2|nr:tetratricopeptide repeat protein [Fulvivirga maritima]UII27707.1 tetratricopeptide repeat-containing sensor histidine kinase [Fulvivirga maritima]
MMPRFLVRANILMYCVLGVFTAKGQAHKVDSLRALILNADDTVKIKGLISLSMAYQNSDLDSALYYAERCLHEAEALGHKESLGDALINLGRLKRDKGQYDVALEYIFKSLNIYKELSDSVRIGNAINDISIVYGYSGDWEKALQYFTEALHMFQKVNDLKGEAQALNNIGLVYLQYFDDLEKAEEYFLKSLEIKQARGDKKDLGTAYGNLGKIMEENKQYDRALDYYRIAGNLYIEVNNDIFLIENRLDIANVYLQTGKLHQAYDTARVALDLAIKTHSNIALENASNTLMRIAELQGDYEKAYAYLKLNTDARDSLLRENNNQHLEELKQQYNAEDRENQIKLLQKDKQIQQANLRQKDILTYALISVIILVLIILLLVYWAYQSNKNKKDVLAFKNAKIQLQKENLLRMNKGKDQLFSIISHDIKSPLNSLKGFSNLLVNNIDMLSKEDIQQMGGKINHSLNNLSELLDNLLAWSIRQTKTQKLELVKVDINDLITKNIELYTLTAASKKITLSDYSESDLMALADINSIHTVIRNLIGNAIKFSYPDGEIKIRAFNYGDKVKVSVIDNGVGMSQEYIDRLFDLGHKDSQAGTSNEKGSGLGLILCQELIKDNNGEFHVHSELEKGSTFSFTLPRFTED